MFKKSAAPHSNVIKTNNNIGMYMINLYFLFLIYSLIICSGRSVSTGMSIDWCDRVFSTKYITTRDLTYSIYLFCLFKSLIIIDVICET